MPDSGQEQDRTATLANELIGLDADDLTSDDHNQLGRLLLDHLGCVYRGASLPWGAAMRDWAKPYDGSGKAVVIGAGLSVQPPVAALVNGAAAHGLELDDTHDESVTHPGAVVIAAALAVGAQAGSSGRDVLAAIVAGYEAIGRVGAATGAAELIERGFHPTALFGCFGSAVTAARLMGLNADQLVRAWGLALSMTGGSMQFSQDPEGTTVKRLHGGYSAHHGALAAELARAGMAGPAQAFDGRYGLLALYGETPAIGRLDGNPDGVREIHRISFKPYPCCRLFHSTLDALAEVTDDYRIQPEDIAAIDVGGPAILVTQHMLRRPTSVMAAQYALPFTLATAFYHGPRATEGFAPEAQTDPRILDLADRVTSHPDDAFEAAFPAHFGSSVSLTTRTGERREVRVLDSLGTPANPLDRAQLIDKFDAMVAPVGRGPNGREAADLVDTVVHMKTLDPLLAPFAT